MSFEFSNGVANVYIDLSLCSLIFHFIQELEDVRKSLEIKKEELDELQEKLNAKERVSTCMLLLICYSEFLIDIYEDSPFFFNSISLQ